jgi:hypothetical protein
MTAKDYFDPKGYWGDPSGNIRRRTLKKLVSETQTTQDGISEVLT